ncbi:hypothetical protein EDB81DRAFT_950303 [Dactylonectria macrodidyma]|uniref:Uncharacterized protein n=1 Tax=Dactylonectria macrodidyma TaxID=307937 RepID=A0A9P9IRW8_9HYPO|nr:hypothetical protein EDB81DRAFT_950303 [Dactylonectria macrodidyma]
MEPIQIMNIYPIAIGIMDALSASDVSAFLHATRLYRIFTKEFSNKYMNLERDMPSIRHWLERRRRIGDHVAFLGKDIYTLLDRYNNVLSHWTRPESSHVCQVWVLVVSRYAYEMRLQNGASVYDTTVDGDVIRHNWVDPDGNVTACEYATPSPMKFIHDPTYDCHGDKCMSRIPVGTIVLPDPDSWPKCSTNIYQNRMGAPANVPNGNEKRVATRFHIPLKYPLGIFSGYMDEKYKMRYVCTREILGQAVSALPYVTMHGKGVAEMYEHAYKWRYRHRNQSGDMVESVSPLEVVNMLAFVFQDCGLGPVESTYFTMPIRESE